MPYCNQSTFVPILTACLAIIGASAEGRKTLTISIGIAISCNFSITVSPFIFFPAAKDLQVLLDNQILEDIS